MLAEQPQHQPTLERWSKAAGRFPYHITIATSDQANVRNTSVRSTRCKGCLSLDPQWCLTFFDFRWWLLRRYRIAAHIQVLDAEDRHVGCQNVRSC